MSACFNSCSPLGGTAQTHNQSFSIPRVNKRHKEENILVKSHLLHIQTPTVHKGNEFGGMCVQCKSL